MPSQSSRRLDRPQVVEARDSLRKLLEAIERGELTASRGHVERLEGAVMALSALLGDESSDG